jgi:hypothetical protein
MPSNLNLIDGVLDELKLFARKLERVPGVLVKLTIVNGGFDPVAMLLLSGPAYHEQ